jgi:TRAP-type C4-dicarboxylate transport system permease small subunit
MKIVLEIAKYAAFWVTMLGALLMVSVGEVVRKDFLLHHPVDWQNALIWFAVGSAAVIAGDYGQQHLRRRLKVLQNRAS